jgi:hypothetical protein
LGTSGKTTTQDWRVSSATSLGVQIGRNKRGMSFTVWFEWWFTGFTALPSADSWGMALEALSCSDGWCPDSNLTLVWGNFYHLWLKKRIQTPKGYPRLADSPLNRDGLGCSPWHCRTHRDVVQIYHHSAWTQQKQNFVCCHFGCNQYSSGQTMIIKHTVMFMFINSTPFKILMVETIRLWWNWGGSYCFIHILNYHLPRCIQA